MAEDVRRFFDEYAKAASGSDPEDLVSFFDEQALVTGPKGAVAFHTAAQRKRWAAALLGSNRGSGLRELVPTGVGAYELGPAFVLATVQWRAFFHRVERPAEPMMTYLLRRAPDGLRVAAVVEHEAREDVLQRLGVAADPATRRRTRSASLRHGRREGPPDLPSPRAEPDAAQ